MENGPSKLELSYIARAGILEQISASGGINELKKAFGDAVIEEVQACLPDFKPEPVKTEPVKPLMADIKSKVIFPVLTPEEQKKQSNAAIMYIYNIYNRDNFSERDIFLYIAANFGTPVTAQQLSEIAVMHFVQNSTREQDLLRLLYDLATGANNMFGRTEFKIVIANGGYMMCPKGWKISKIKDEKTEERDRKNDQEMGMRERMIAWLDMLEGNKNTLIYNAISFAIAQGGESIDLRKIVTHLSLTSRESVTIKQLYRQLETWITATAPLLNGAPFLISTKIVSGNMLLDIRAREEREEKVTA